MTPSMTKALTILRDHGPIKPREFARLMWPDSPAWKLPAKAGPKGTHKGGGMYTAAGGYLGRLHRAGLAEHASDPTEYRISRAGRARISAEALSV